jgi:cell division septum initiation protein DivIVA
MSLNRRFDVTGLEEPEELWDRLQDATAEVQSLRLSNNSLQARVRQLERQLCEVGGLTDDELVAELPRRMARALESAQSVAAEIVRRAHRQEAAILKKANASASELWKRAQAEAVEIRRRAAADAAAHSAEASAEAQRIVGDAHARRDQIVAQFQEKSASYERHIRRLEDHHARLAGAYDVVERTLTEARRALTGGTDDGTTQTPRPQSSSSKRVEPAARAVTGATKRPVPSTVAAVSRPVVYDWSPTGPHDV